MFQITIISYFRVIFAFIKKLDYNYVIKPTGLCSGKGVKVSDIHFSNDRGMVFIAFDRGKDHIYYYPNIDIESSKFTAATTRQKIRQGQYIAKFLDKRKIEK